MLQVLHFSKITGVVFLDVRFFDVLFDVLSDVGFHVGVEDLGFVTEEEYLSFDVNDEALLYVCVVGDDEVFLYVCVDGDDEVLLYVRVAE
mgnify:CR=1 FL=1